MDSHTKKLLTSILLLVILFAGLITVLVLVRQRQIIEKKAVGGTAAMVLPTSFTAIQGQQFTIPIRISSTTAVSGVDIVVDFTAAKTQAGLTLVGINYPAKDNTNFKTFVPIFSTPAPGTFDTATVISRANTTGIVEFGAVTFIYRESDPPTPTPSPTTIPAQVLNIGNIFAELVFVANSVPSTNPVPITIKYDSIGATTDSNVVEADTAADILNSVTNLNLTVNPSVEPTSTPTTGPTVTTTPVPTATPTGISSNKRDLSSSTVGVPDGIVDNKDVSYVLQLPYPCGGIFGACPSLTGSPRDISSSNVGSPDGIVDNKDVSYVLQLPYPCGGIFGACPAL